MTNLELFTAVSRSRGTRAGLEAIGVRPDGDGKSRSPEAQAIINVVAVAYDIQPALILSRGNHRHVVAARHAAMKEMRAIGWSYPVIGREMDRDSSTVYVALNGRKR